MSGATTPAPVEVAGRVFRRRKLSGAARLQVMDAVADQGDAADVIAGLEAEMDHLAREAEALATEPAFDRERRDQLNEDRRRLRRELQQARDLYWRAQLALVAAQTQDPPDREWCVEHLSPEDVDRIYRSWEGDEEDPPTESVTETAGPVSS